ncbi:MAG: Mur ligase family protein [Bdellovibrionales bacterium]
MNNELLWRAEDVMLAVQGRGLHEQSWTAKGISIDSATTKPGDLFIARQDPLHDGHDCVGDAFAAGAVAALVARQPSQVPPDIPLVFVSNTYEALLKLGRVARERMCGKIIAVMGSIGKTSTTEMMRLSLGAVGNVYASVGAANAWGLALAMASQPWSVNYGIYEMSDDSISALAPIIRPDIAVVTLIETAAAVKAELFKSMDKNGTVILDNDSPCYDYLARVAKKSGVKNILTYSGKNKATACLLKALSTKEGSAVNAKINGQDISYLIGAFGEHHVKNSLAVLLASFAASGKLEECAASLPHYRPPEGCGDLHEIILSDGGRIKLFDESRSASPVSVRAAIRVLAQSEISGKGRRIFVIGDMDDLGITAPDLHMELVPDILSAGISLVFCCGDTTRYLFDALPESLRGGYAVDSEEMASLLAQTVQDSDVLTVKGSKGMEMGKVIDALTASPQQKTAYA